MFSTNISFGKGTLDYTKQFHIPSTSINSTRAVQAAGTSGTNRPPSAIDFGASLMTRPKDFIHLTKELEMVLVKVFKPTGVYYLVTITMRGITRAKLATRPQLGMKRHEEESGGYVTSC
ncbi:hypothetical protein Q1695_013082 [Nippostrongylus brasiliensis]|nr:hypothetical protein Q1695_013082 [Nippostrongylus brasiliensis]